MFATCPHCHGTSRQLTLPAVRPGYTHRCSAVIHHGGVGTTGAGLRCGKPSLVVPFFGDLYLWGDVVARLGVGPAAVPVEQLSVERLLPALRVLRDRRVGGVAPECVVSAAVGGCAASYWVLCVLSLHLADRCGMPWLVHFCRVNSQRHLSA
jgi:hypothetical protein